MKVYVINQEWMTDSEGRDYTIIGVYDSYEKAKRKLEELYREDKDWLLSDRGFDELEEDTLTGWSSFVQGNEDYWSGNEIQSFELE